MKAPQLVDAYLRNQGFGYAKPYYLRHNPHRKLDESWSFTKNPEGLTLEAMVFYPEGSSGVGVSPLEIGCLYPDGRVSCSPSRDWPGAFWDPKAVDTLIEALSGPGAVYLAQLSEPELMLRVLEFLMSSRDSDVRCPPEFPELHQPWVLRKVTPNRLTGKAAYLTLLGRFEDAQAAIAQIPPRMLTPGDEKILADAKARSVQVPPESIAFLRSIGAQVA